MKPGIDIIVLCFNNIAHIKKCVEAIHWNTLSEHKLIVIDQNSTDGSREWLLSCPHIDKLILNKDNNGAWEGRNQGLREAEHEWQMFLDSDTEIRQMGWDSAMISYGKDPKVGLVEARVQLYNGDWRFAGFAANMIRNEVFREIGRFDHHFLIGGDNDFWVRFWWNGKFKIAYCPETDIYHFCGGTITRGCLKEQAAALDTCYRNELLRTKYTDNFLNKTLWTLNAKRLDAEKKMGWRE